MPLRLHRYLKRVASSFMLAGTLAFILQGTMISVSDAVASMGLMPQPAETLGGSFHLHDHLAGHVHHHGGDNAAGHAHSLADPDDDDLDDIGKTLFWSLGATSPLMAVGGPLALFLPPCC